MAALRKRRLLQPLAALLVTAALVGSGALGFYYVRFSRLIEARLAGERDRVVPRVLARPLTFSTGQFLSAGDAAGRLNDLGYLERGRADTPGAFAAGPEALTLVPRAGSAAGKPVTMAFSRSRRGAVARLSRIVVDGAPVSQVTLEEPVLTGLTGGTRQKRRRVALDAIPARVREAVLAIEDRRFYYHPGVDPIRIAGATLTNVFGRRDYLVGASTITQQLARTFFLADEMAAEQQTGVRSFRRKLLEQVMAVILETKATKDEILELYLNEVYLGHRGSYAVHGVAQAARTFFGKDVANLSLGESALVAGVIQSPYHHSPFTSVERARQRRDVVLRAMAEAGAISPDAATRAAAEPIVVAPRALDSEAPYFVDYMQQVFHDTWPGLTGGDANLEIHTSLDLHVQRAAQEAVAEGLGRVDRQLARRRGPPRRAEAALLAVDPRSGEILAMVGGRFYNQSQFNRAVLARRQPGSTFKPFVFLAAFEQAAAQGRADLTPATLVEDEPTTWTFEGRDWTPRNYDQEYDGAVTLRRALAMSRNVATIKVAERTGFEAVARLWSNAGVGAAPLKGYPSIALGAFELTPLDLATAYTLFPNGGTITPQRPIRRVVSGDDTLEPPPARGVRVASPATTYLVTDMMRSVLDEGTGAGARRAGFALDAAGKSGTTNDLRDAWFVGFTPELLAVVWVGLDDNRPLGLSGGQAALPIWTAFMQRALAGRPNTAFATPEGISLVEIDRDTGQLATPACPRTGTESFLAGTEPLDYCALHRW